MAGHCPQCGTAVDQDFGLTTCTKCGTLLSVSLSGDIAVASEGADLAPVEDNSSANFSPSLEEPVIEENPTPEVQSTEFVPYFPSNEESPLEAEEPGIAPPEVEPQAEYQFINTEFQPEYLQTNETETSPTPEEKGEDSPVLNLREADPGPLDFSDVEDYGNQSELLNSPLVYQLWIEEINSVELRAKLREVLSDIRLNLMVDEILGTLKNGRLELKNLNPIKASVIVGRLQEESLQFGWRQSVYQNSDQNSDQNSESNGASELGSASDSVESY